MIIEPNGTKRIVEKKVVNSKKRPADSTTFEQETKRANDWMHEAQEAIRRANVLDVDIVLARVEIDTIGRRIAKLNEELAETRSQLQSANRSIRYWRMLANNRGDRIRELEGTSESDTKLEELKRMLDEANSSADRYRNDNEFKSGLIKDLWEKAEPSGTGLQREVKSQKAVIQHLLKAMSELIA